MFPIVALIISTVLEDFVWTAPALAGVALILGGNVLAIARPKRRPAPGPQPAGPAG
jgi:drug/metabolite transporter (DMT)-like permease